ncbi:hypothetical protein HWV62_44231 [Athelia sp. TMB]|nr:hypothetical protein HWV62_44231 [Athelia sp. TMB]
MSLENTFDNAIEANAIPGAVLVATNRSGLFPYPLTQRRYLTIRGTGTLNYERAFGKAGASPNSKPMTLDSVFWIASCTKLMTAIAVLQCVERGLFALDSSSDVARLLPEYAAPEIVTAFDEHGKPIMKAASSGITLRHLLTHTSGMGYDTRGPLALWRESRGEQPGCAFLGDLAMPLTFEPGKSWDYSTGVDWAGKMVERANGGISLDKYMQAHLWEPLGLRSMTFHLEQKEDSREQLVEMARRAPETGLLTPSTGNIIANPSKDSMGGIGVYASARDYLQILASLLRDDCRLLTPSGVEELFKPQLSQACKNAWMGKAGARHYVLTGGLAVGTDLTWALGGTSTEQDIDGRRKKGSMSWGGLPNLFWWIDRETGITGMYASQVVPQGDAKSCELFADFEKLVYEMEKELAFSE